MNEPTEPFREAPATPAGSPRARLAALAIFRDLGEAELAALVERLEWFSLPGGWRLFSEGDVADALYIVASGRLAILVSDATRQEQPVAEIGAGETVGEMALVSGEVRSATVVALRDSELLRLTKPAYEELLARNPQVLSKISALLAARLNRVTHHYAPVPSPRTLALVPLGKGVKCPALAHGLRAAFDAIGIRTWLLAPTAPELDTERLHGIEAAHELTLYEAEPDATTWTRLCLRQADRVLLVAAAEGEPMSGAALEAMLRPGQLRFCDLVLLSARGAEAPSPAGPWLDRLPVGFFQHIRLERVDDIARLARLLTNRATGIVLSGGGARGLAHIGVVRALRAAGVPFDLIGGTSMGAIVGAGVALEWDDRELKDRMRDAFVAASPLNDLTLPLIALFRGRRVSRLLRANFGDVRVEDLWRPYFCVSSNLTTAQAAVHRQGSLCRALRASVAIPGILPPVIENGEVLVDGGVINNFPVDVMRAQRRGPVIGVDVAADRALTSIDSDLEEASLWRVLRERRKVPWILSILMRAGTVSSDAQARALRAQANLLLEPPLEAIDMLDWQSFDRIVELGYRYAMGKLERVELRSLTGAAAA